MNTNNLMTSRQALRAKKWRFNPLTHLQADTLSRHLDAFEGGHLREAASIWDALEQRDDLLRAVISKRKKSVARHGWTVLPKADLDPSEKTAARDHARALEYFYNHLECEHAVDTAERGGFKLLARQMMDAVGKRFAVHEIIWKAPGEGEGDAPDAGRSRMNNAPDATAPTEGGTHRNFVSAKFRFVPLGFFENTTGRLRFLENESAQEGRDLEPGAWMVTVGDGLMIASSTAWMFKHLSLDDWLQCSQRNGTPALRGISSAARDSAEWNALEGAIEDLLEGQSIVHSTADDVDVLNLMGGTAIPFPELVERIDRMLAALWRGADLSTISRERGYGASLQEKETCALEEDDAEMLTETLHRYVDEWVIRHVFGEGVRPLAQIRVLVSPRECTTGDLQIDEFLLKHGAPLSLQETMSRYGRALPEASERVLGGQREEGAPRAPRAGGSPHEAHANQGGAHPELLHRSRELHELPTEETQASLPESSHHGSVRQEADHEGFGCGPSVSFRVGSPANKETTKSDARPPDGAGFNLRGGIGEEPAALPNEFTLLQDDWLQLSPYGDFPHARGLQRVDRAAADGMVAQFHSFRGRLGRLFGGVPFYVGHPDLAGAGEGIDRKAYGWIMELAARDDGFYGRVKWSEAGLDLLRNAHFKFLSPYWEAREIAHEQGRRIYRPAALISAGLTNQPNIPVRPLANETEEKQENLAETSPHCEAMGNAPVRLEKSSSPPMAECRPRMRTMHTTSCTEGLGHRKPELARLQNRRERIREAVLAKVRLGLSYDEAWENVKREHVRWFEGR